MNKYFIKTIGYTIAGLLVLALLPAQTFAFEQRANTSSAKWISQSPGSSQRGSTVIYATPGQVLDFSLTIKNTSKTDVFYSASNLINEPYPYQGAHELRVGATDDLVYANIFDFSTGGPFVNNNRFVTFENGKSIYPGDYLTFYWSLKVRSGIPNGNYHYAVGVVQEYDAWLGDPPGPGAGGSNNNLGGRSSGNIFWDIVIGGSAYMPPQNRILITANQYGYYDISGFSGGGSCSNDFNTDSATTTVNYSNIGKGISIDLPYNSNWGSSQYRINGYDTTSGDLWGHVIFGFIAPFEGCTVVRDYSIRFLSAKSISEVITDIQDTEDPPGGIITKKLNNLDVVEYTGVGMCNYPTVIVIGQKSNYQFKKICNGTMVELENIASTVELI
ncbi:hypothetical protein KJ836_04005 [Patescibacteria group bacterium]|nr:hypothetical protein [Patescibacteria group bacterium]